MAKNRIIFSSVAGLVVAAGFLVLASSRTVWVGRTDLEVKFIVLDPNSGSRIPSATVAVDWFADVNHGEQLAPQHFTLKTANNGEAKSSVKDCMSFGSGGSLFHRSSYSVHLPRWRFRATAPGFIANEWEYLAYGDTGKRREVRGGNGRAIVEVVIPMRRDASK